MMPTLMLVFVSPQFLCDVYFESDAVRPMSVITFLFRFKILLIVWEQDCISFVGSVWIYKASM